MMSNFHVFFNVSIGSEMFSNGPAIVLLGLFIFLSAPQIGKLQSESLDAVKMFPDVEQQVIEAGSTLIMKCIIDRKIITSLNIFPFWSLPQIAENKTVWNVI